MIIIRGVQYQGIHNQSLADWFGLSYNWTEGFYSYIHTRVKDANQFRFNSVNDIVSSYLNSVRGRFNLPPLTLAAANLFPPGTPFPITMTGDRNQDIAGLPAAPANYTWHHAENIWYANRHLHCNMYLVASAYHSANHHCGGVNEYKWIYAIGYRDS